MKHNECRTHDDKRREQRNARMKTSRRFDGGNWDNRKKDTYNRKRLDFAFVSAMVKNDIRFYSDIQTPEQLRIKTDQTNVLSSLRISSIEWICNCRYFDESPRYLFWICLFVWTHLLRWKLINCWESFRKWRRKLIKYDFTSKCNWNTHALISGLHFSLHFDSLMSCYESSAFSCFDELYKGNFWQWLPHHQMAIEQSAKVLFVGSSVDRWRQRSQPIQRFKTQPGLLREAHSRDSNEKHFAISFLSFTNEHFIEIYLFCFLLIFTNFHFIIFRIFFRLSLHLKHCSSFFVRFVCANVTVDGFSLAISGNHWNQICNEK